MEKLTGCVLGIAVLAIMAVISFADGNKAVAQTNSDLARYLGRVGSESVYKFSDGPIDCYVVVGGNGRPAISCAR